MIYRVATNPIHQIGANRRDFRAISGHFRGGGKNQTTSREEEFPTFPRFPGFSLEGYSARVHGRAARRQGFTPSREGGKSGKSGKFLSPSCDWIFPGSGNYPGNRVGNGGWLS